MKIAIVDIETTGFNHMNDCIVEIGIVELCLKTGQRKIIYDELVRENHYNHTHKNSWIIQNSSLTHNEICCANPLDKEKIQEILDNYLVTAYNKKFDFEFLRSRGLKIKELPCPMKIATNICKIPSRKTSYSWGIAQYKYPSVEEAYRFFIGDEKYLEEHRGAADAMDEAKIVYELHKRGEFNIH